MGQGMTLDNQTKENISQVAQDLADAARPIALKYFRKSGQELKNKLAEGFDPVTIADREIEAAMREILGNARPDDSILGEEFEAVIGTSGIEWVLDPIDGTRGFISGTPTWGVLIAVNTGDFPVLGIIDQPYIGERFTGGFGQASHVKGGVETPLVVRASTELAGATLFTTFPEVGKKAERQAFNRVAQKVQLTRYGTDCYAYGLLAAGQVDLVIEAGLNAYDIQAPIAVVEAAGGIVTNWSGGPAHRGGQAIAAATPELHQAALALLAGA